MYSGHPGGGGTERTARRKKLTAPDLRARKGGRPIAMVTAYDFTMAKLLDEAGVDALLVGDSLGMVVQGHSTTIPVTLDEICYHTRAVARAAASAHVVGDMPFMSYQVSPLQALENAGKLVKDGCAESVKLEGGAVVAEHVLRIVQAGIPVMGHVGLTPQSVHALGGFRVQGKSHDEADRIVDDAVALEEAGVYAVVLEAVPPDVAARVTERLTVPTIGIGAGVECDGQVLVCYDLLGMTSGRTPKFAKRFDEIGERIRQATSAFVSEVGARRFPAPEHAYARVEPKLAVVKS
jgi:3-methyl-2-oxobutanoate hydroxymethyltransferase